MKKSCIALFLALLMMPFAALAQSPMQMPVDSEMLIERLMDAVSNTEDAQRRVDLVLEAAEIAPESYEVQIVCAQLLLILGFEPEYRTALDDILAQAVKLAGTDEEKALAYSSWAEILLLEGEEDEAVKMLRDAAKVDADNEAIRTALATVLYYAGERDEAIALLEELLEDSPQNLEARRLRATVLLDEYEWEEAMQAFRQIEKEWPDYFDGIYGQFLTYIASGRFEEGIRALDTILAMGGDDTLWLERARIRLWKQYDAEQVLTETDALLRMDGSWVDALITRMIALIMLERYDEAYEVADAAQKVEPDYGDFLRAVTSVNEGEYEKADALLQALIKRVPSFYNAYSLWAAVALYSLDDTEIAMDRMREAFAITEGIGDQDMYSQLGQIYYYQREYQQAALAYSAADMSIYDDPSPLSNIVVILLECGRGADAEEVTEEMERRYPGWYETMMARLNVENAKGNAEDALAVFEALSEKFPNAYFTGLESMGAMLMVAAGDAQGIETLLAMAREEGGGTVMNWCGVASAYTMLGDWDAAQEAVDTANDLLFEETEALQEAVARRNLKIQLYCAEADLHMAQGNQDEALALWEKAAGEGWVPGILLLDERYREITETDAYAAMMAEMPDPAEPWDLSEMPKIPE